MFAPRLNRVFRSRWSALWWAGWVLFSAWRIASGGDAITAAAKPSPTKTAQPASDPWALDPK